MCSAEEPCGAAGSNVLAQANATHPVPALAALRACPARNVLDLCQAALAPGSRRVLNPWEKDVAMGGGAWQIRGEQSRGGDVFPSCLTVCLRLPTSMLLLFESQVGKETLEESCVQRAG